MRLSVARLAPVLAILCLALPAAPARADIHGFQTGTLTAAELERAVKAAEALARATTSARPRPLGPKEPGIALVPWLLERSQAHTRAGNTRVRQTLRRFGYRGGDVIDEWTETMARVLRAYDATERGVVGKDVSRLYQRLGRARGQRRERLLYRIQLGSVSKAEAAAVARYSQRLRALLVRARRSR